jgi:hypothetical protein
MNVSFCIFPKSQYAVIHQLEAPDIFSLVSVVIYTVILVSRNFQRRPVEEFLGHMQQQIWGP